VIFSIFIIVSLSPPLRLTTAAILSAKVTFIPPVLASVSISVNTL
jgi:hypothetical protein